MRRFAPACRTPPPGPPRSLVLNPLIYRRHLSRRNRNSAGSPDVERRSAGNALFGSGTPAGPAERPFKAPFPGSEKGCSGKSPRGSGVAAPVGLAHDTRAHPQTLAAPLVQTAKAQRFVAAPARRRGARTRGGLSGWPGPSAAAGSRTAHSSTLRSTARCSSGPCATRGRVFPTRSSSATAIGSAELEVGEAHHDGLHARLLETDAQRLGRMGRPFSESGCEVEGVGRCARARVRGSEA